MHKLRFFISSLFVAAAFGQTASDLNKLNFEVASVKKAAPPQFGRGRAIAFGRRGGPGTADPGQITWSGVTLKMLISDAYDVKRYQVSGPAWLDMERYDIVAKVPPGTTKEQVRVMWQNLLADRFGVALHQVSKVFPVDEMVPAKGGVKLKETTLDAKAVADSSPDGGGLPPPPLPPPPGGVTAGGRGPGMPEIDNNGVPQLTRPGLFMMMTISSNGPSARMVGKAQTIEQLAAMLSNQLGHPVVDKTGLTAKYDFVLEFTPDFNGGMLPPGAVGLGAGPGLAPAGGDSTQVPKASDPAGATLIAALQQQLGLRLVATKAPLDTIVIDKAEKEPTEN
ncbi:MAG TPA: TIGR03435 family protein [Bryobacteraceae bacterium]|jgi:uncharacterized protein (TIGR03435 family)